jgi:ABC-type uncharacterized transport system permease subunit
MPSSAQLSLLIIAIALFAASGRMSALRGWTQSERPGLRDASRWCLIGGIVALIALLVWHAASRGQWLPIGDNFDALIWLSTLLALFILYVQRHRQLGALDWFVLPIVLLMLVAAGVLGRTDYHPYHPGVRHTWSWVHRVTAYGGAVAFAIAAASGAMYVISSRRLRSKAPVGPNFASLERLERLTMSAVTLGFALLTVGIITGAVTWAAAADKPPVAKLALTLGVWLVYAVVLHAPINPSFRGRKVAVLSVVGFVLMVSVLITVLLLPGGTR